MKLFGVALLVSITLSAPTVELSLVTHTDCPDFCSDAAQCVAKLSASLDKFPDCDAQVRYTFNGIEESINVCQQDLEEPWVHIETKDDDETAIQWNPVAYYSLAGFELAALAEIGYRTRGYESGNLVIHLQQAVANDCDLVHFELRTLGVKPEVRCAPPRNKATTAIYSQMLQKDQMDISLPLNTDDPEALWGFENWSEYCLNLTGATLEYQNVRIIVQLNPYLGPYAKQRSTAAPEEAWGQVRTIGLLLVSMVIMLHHL
eukprot:Blabericola_migrator_1__8811@NODE_4652_length_1038_cov_584_500515_g2894_i0_p1_GENE_NODE_4652_length_1038_cov_584_500515_g2894_i0NODE_4652_length_1038_cov_584_500515_g2894_i0_p1_ORF_typecomplete_len260_score34_13_NODE_4652_length_1038_cov_584_500515_g2894_i0174953